MGLALQVQVMRARAIVVLLDQMSLCQRKMVHVPAGLIMPAAVIAAAHLRVVMCPRETALVQVAAIMRAQVIVA